jgi:hypothetical protein
VESIRRRRYSIVSISNHYPKSLIFPTSSRDNPEDIDAHSSRIPANCDTSSCKATSQLFVLLDPSQPPVRDSSKQLVTGPLLKSKIPGLYLFGEILSKPVASYYNSSRISMILATHHRATDHGISTGKSTMRRKRKVGAATYHHLTHPAKKVNAALTKRRTRHIQMQKESGNEISSYWRQPHFQTTGKRGDVLRDEVPKKALCRISHTVVRKRHLAISPSLDLMIPYSTTFLWKSVSAPQSESMVFLNFHAFSMPG